MAKPHEAEPISATSIHPEAVTALQKEMMAFYQQAGRDWAIVCGQRWSFGQHSVRSLPPSNPRLRQCKPIRKCCLNECGWQRRIVRNWRLTPKRSRRKLCNGGNSLDVSEKERPRYLRRHT